MKAFARFKQLGAYQKRGIVYGMVGVIGMGAELLLRPSPRLLVMLLWAGLIGIAALVYFLIQEPDK
ncbi:MAG TPA: hypothetical protein PKN04_03065 [bacterium]|jgi:hypothetical protein|nr:hypothetical protein [bacterium]HNT64736.1 hypothetical protein [bacterium]HOX85897.1 hypothetical protein [bacterium]HPG45120.1 hypothetical protein [bacterium]HPM97362.1 hypothetical protein [bacterium]